MRKPVFGVSDQVRHKPGRTVQKMARGLKFRIWKVKGLYYPCSENKGADQLRRYREADLRLCFCICKKAAFLTMQLIYLQDVGQFISGQYQLSSKSVLISD